MKQPRRQTALQFAQKEVWRHQNKDNFVEGLYKALKTIKYINLNPYNRDNNDNENTD